MSGFICGLFALFFLCAWGAAPLRAAPYGHGDDFEEDFREDETSGYSHYIYNNKASPYLMYALAGKAPVRICVHIGDKERKKIAYKDLTEQIYYAYHAWTLDAGDMIIEAGRAKEFKEYMGGRFTGVDVVKADWKMVGGDDNKIKAVYDFTEEGPCDLQVIYDLEYCGIKPGGAAFFTSKPNPRICLDDDGLNISKSFKKDEDGLNGQRLRRFLKGKSFHEFSLSTLMHEMGHAMGLGDQYDGGLWNSDVLYSTIKPRKAIMRCDSPVLTCDDLDGIVTLFYRVKKQSKTFDSFCGGGLVIQDGKPVLKKKEEKFVPYGQYSAYGSLYKLNPDGSYTADKVIRLDPVKDREYIEKEGFDLSYFNKSQKVYFTMPEKQPENPDQRYWLLMQGDKAQSVAVTNDGKYTPVAAPVNLVKTTDSKGNAVFTMTKTQPQSQKSSYGPVPRGSAPGPIFPENMSVR